MTTAGLAALPVRAEGLGPLPAYYTQHGSSMNVDLAHLGQPSDGVMDGLEMWRSAGELDAVMLIVPNTTPPAGSSRVCGLANVATSVDGTVLPYGVAAMASGCELTYTHELGHIFGAHHNVENAPSGTVFPWSYGHYVNGVARSVMSYSSPCTSGCNRVAQWSDPHDSFVGHPGVPSGLPYRDNDRSLTDLSWAITEIGETDSNDFIWYRSASGHTSHTVNGDTGDDIEAPYTPIAGDFNGDGRSDQLWYFPGRPRERLWTFGSAAGSYSQVSKDVQGDYTPIVGDFDGDGRDDLFWYGPGGVVDSIWWGTASPSAFGTAANIGYPTISGSAYRPVSGDFDGDGRDDILWYGPGAVPDTFWWGNPTRSSFVSGAGSTSVSIGNTYPRPFAGDFNGDGRDDIFLYAPGSAFDALWHGRAVRAEIGPLHQTTVSVGGTYVPLSGDLDGDGDDDVFWYGPGTNPDRIWWGQTSMATFAGQAGSAVTVNGTYEPTIGDFNGDGYHDPFWFSFG